MEIRAAAFSAPKAGSLDSEYEDDAWPDRRFDASGQEVFRCAVADGATETSYSRIWAHELVGAYANSRLEGPTRDEISMLRAKWQKFVDKRLVKPHAWYMDTKARSGAFAALVCLRLEDGAERPSNWSAYAMGDCCLVQLRGDDVLGKFPLSDSNAFNDRPRLLGSTSGDTVDETMFGRMSGSWQHGDTFFLMSDAIAAWFYRRCEAGDRPWLDLGKLDARKRSGFHQWLGELRRAKDIKNDDVTVLRVQVLASAAAGQ